MRNHTEAQKAHRRNAIFDFFFLLFFCFVFLAIYSIKWYSIMEIENTGINICSDKKRCTYRRCKHINLYHHKDKISDRFNLSHDFSHLRPICSDRALVCQPDKGHLNLIRVEIREGIHILIQSCFLKFSKSLKPQ